MLTPCIKKDCQAVRGKMELVVFIGDNIGLTKKHLNFRPNPSPT